MSLIHHSQVSQNMIRPGNLAKPIAVSMAEVLGAEAFLWEEDGDWYAFDEYDEDTEQPEINWFWLSAARYQKMRDFK